MGGLISRHVKVVTKEPDTQGTPKHTRVLPYDPRSPSDYLTRTPITVANTPDKGCEDTPRIFKVLSLDPRSPNTEVNRTPIVVESKDVHRRHFSLKPSKLERLYCKPATTQESNESDEHDPRLPTTKVPQTPLEGKEETFLVPAVDETKAIEKTNSDEGRKVTENKSMDEEDKSYVNKLFSNDESTDKGSMSSLPISMSSLPISMSAAANMTTQDNLNNKTMGEKPNQTNPVEQYILLAKQAKGAASVELVKQVLEAPDVYVFGELMEMPNITNLKNNPQHAPYFELLQLFAYGVYGDYVKEASKFPQLTPTMLTKLRHLTIVSMATGQKSIPLVTLGNQLGLTSTRELEDLIIEAMYTDIIHGKLDQKNGILELDHAIGRDVKPEDLPNIVATLQSSCDTCDTMLANIDQLITHANSDKEKLLKHRNSLETEEYVNLSMPHFDTPPSSCESPLTSDALTSH